jgi:Probable molybdopterin binding domain
VIVPTADSSASKEVVTAALLVIGGKILSGRTKDQNIGYIAEYLTAVGIDLKEVRVVGDEETAIVDALNGLQHCYTSCGRDRELSVLRSAAWASAKNTEWFADIDP